MSRGAAGRHTSLKNNWIWLKNGTNMISGTRRNIKRQRPGTYFIRIKRRRKMEA